MKFLMPRHCGGFTSPPTSRDPVPGAAEADESCQQTGVARRSFAVPAERVKPGRSHPAELCPQRYPGMAVASARCHGAHDCGAAD